MAGIGVQIGWQKGPFGSTGLTVDPLCFGTAEIGGLNNVLGAVSEERAVATARAIFDGPTNFADTATGYGESERRLGVALQARGGLPEGFVLSTKVNCGIADGLSPSDETRRSVERSLELLGLQRLQIVMLHNPEFSTFEKVMAPDGPFETIRRCKEEGLVEHVGVAGGEIDIMTRCVETGGFEVVLCHNRYTLLNRVANPLWDLAKQRGMATMNAAIYGGGILSKGPNADPRYAYSAASPHVIGNVRRLQTMCARFNVPLAAAALQFSLREPRIDATVVGTSRPERVAETIALAQRPIPDELWAEIATVEPSMEDFRS
jgi:D-threo-aldose 1-dehydrogenase